MCIPEPYWSDPYKDQFEIEIEKIDKSIIFTSKKLPVFLGGGGQPPDQVTIVLENQPPLTIKSFTEKTLLLKKPIKFISSLKFPIKAILYINMNIRKGLMRAHTAQHILSAILKNRFNIETEKAVLKEDEGKLFINSLITTTQIKEAIKEFYKIMQKDLEINSHVIDRENTDSSNNIIINLDEVRGGIPQNEKCIRIVEVPGIDLNTCGGTHLQKTTEIMSISIVDVKKDSISLIVGKKALAHNLELQRYALDLSALIKLPIEDSLKRSLTLLEAIPIQEKKLFNLQKSLVKNLFNLLHDKFKDIPDSLENYSLGSFKNPILESQNLPTRVWSLQDGIIVVINLAFISRSVFLASLPDFLRPTVIIAELEKKNLICQTSNESFFSAKEFIEILSKKTNSRGGGNPRQAQCSIRNIENIYEKIFESIQEIINY